MDMDMSGGRRYMMEEINSFEINEDTLASTRAFHGIAGHVGIDAQLPSLAVTA